MPAGTAALIVYRMRPASPGRVSQFHQRLFGQTTSTRGKRYHRTGILEGIPHWRVARGVLVVREVDREKVLDIVQALAHEVNCWRIELDSRQLRRLTR